VTNVIHFPGVAMKPDIDSRPRIAEALNNDYSDEDLSPEAKARVVERMTLFGAIIRAAISIQYSLPADAGFSEAQLATIDEACTEAVFHAVDNVAAAVMRERMDIEAKLELAILLIIARGRPPNETTPDKTEGHSP